MDLVVRVDLAARPAVASHWMMEVEMTEMVMLEVVIMKVVRTEAAMTEVVTTEVATTKMKLTEVARIEVKKHHSSIETLQSLQEADAFPGDVV